MNICKTIIIGIFLRDEAAVSLYFLSLADEFVKLGYKVIIITDEHRIDAVDKTSNPMILTWPSFSPTKLKDFLFLKKIINLNKTKLVIASFNAVNFFILAARICGVPNRVAWIRTLSEQMEGIARWRFFRKALIYKFATKIIVNSPTTKIDAIKTYNIREQKIATLPNLIKDNYEYISKVKEFKIVFVGRFHPSKGIDILLRAFQLICKDFPEVKLIIIGGGDNKEYIQMAKKMKIYDNIEFTGILSRKKVLKHFATAQFGVIPSLAEAFGIVVIDAFSVKTTVIGSNTGGIKMIIDDDNNGLLFPVGDYKVLAEKMKLLLSNVHLREKYAEEAYLTFQRQYNLEKNIKKVASMFDGYIKKKSI